MSALSASLLVTLGGLAGVVPYGETDEPSTMLRIERGEGFDPLLVPRDEKLVFRVHVGVAMLEASVGKVTLTSRVEPYRPSLLSGASADEEGGETVELRVHAKGGYAWYDLDASIETRIVPHQGWPRFAYLYSHRGTEHRRREILIGLREEEWTASYRKDTREGAPEGMRIWRDPASRAIPDGTLDMLSAVYLSRTLVREERRAMIFPILDKLKLWHMRISRGPTRPIESAAGTFDAVQILLHPKPFPDEDVDEEKLERFEGLFGLHGSIHLWADAATGVPVRIRGTLPAGPVDLAIDMVLEDYEGTPPGFRPR